MSRLSVTLSSRQQGSGQRVEPKPDRSEFARLALQEAGRSVRAGAGAVLKARLVAPPRRLLFAPQDLRTADPTVAADLYAGSFVFAGRALATGGRSPFEFRLPSRAWGEVLLGFGWLRHLRAADTALAAAHARALVDQFELEGHGDRRLARDTPVTGPAADLLPEPVAPSPERGRPRLLRPLPARGRARGAAAGARRGRIRPAGPPPRRRRSRSPSRACPARATVRFLRRATRILARELDAQILPDGGPVSRNPRQLLELLLDLLSLRQLYASRGLEPPRALVRAIDRALPFLRTLRHPDGRLALFNGMGRTDADHLATVLVYHEAHAAAPARAPHSGYERLQAGRNGGDRRRGRAAAAPPFARGGRRLPLLRDVERRAARSSPIAARRSGRARPCRRRPAPPPPIPPSPWTASRRPSS